MEPNSMEYWVASLYSMLAVAALLGNIWVIFVVLNQICSNCQPSIIHKRHIKATVQSSATLYLLVLSVVDLISVLPVPFLVIDIFHNEWPFGITLCKLMFLCEGANKSLSPLLLTALSVDRYIAICLPTLLSLRQVRFACFILLLCFVCSLFFILPVLYHSEVDDMLDANQRVHSKCVVEMSRTFDLLQLLFCYVAPLLLICSVYVAILHRLYRHTHKNMAAAAVTTTSSSRTSIPLKQVIRSSVLVVAFYFICWTPYWTLRFFAMLQDTAEAPGYNMRQRQQHHQLPVNNNSLLIAMNSPEMIVYPETLNNVDNNREETLMSDGLDTHQVVLMYLVHALPYAQSAFNWLFYAFLNRNLRNATSHKSSLLPTVLCNAFRSTPTANIRYLRSSSLWRSSNYMNDNQLLPYRDYDSETGRCEDAACSKLCSPPSYHAPVTSESTKAISLNSIFIRSDTWPKVKSRKTRTFLQRIGNKQYKELTSNQRFSSRQFFQDDVVSD